METITPVGSDLPQPSGEGRTRDPIRYRWVSLMLVFLSLLSFAAIFQAIPPVLALIISQLRLSHAEGGLLMGLFALPGVFVSIPAGILADRYGIRRITIISFLLMLFGTLIVVTANSFLPLALGRIVAGIGGFTITIVTPQFISQWFLGREIGLAMGVFNTGVPIGNMFSFNVLGKIGENWGWPWALSAGASLAAITLISFILFYRAPPNRGDNPHHQTQTDLSSLMQTARSIWLVGASWGGFTAAQISFMTFTPVFLVSKGYPIYQAGFITSLIMVGSIVLNPIIGITIDRTGREEVLIAIGGISLAVFNLLIPSSVDHIVLIVLLMGVASACVPAGIFSLPARIVRPQHFGLSFGIIFTFANLGVLVGPFLVGLAKDFTNSYDMGFTMISIYAILSATMVTWLNLTRRRSTWNHDERRINPRS